MNKKQWCTWLLAGCLPVLAQDAVETAPNVETAEQVQAAEAIQPADVQSLNGDMKAVVVLSAGQMIDEAFEKYKNERGFDCYGIQDKRGVTYVTGKAIVKRNVDSTDFIKSRTFAYETAYHNAVSAMVLSIAGREVSQKIHHFFNDNSTDANTPQSFDDVKSTLEAKTAALDEGLIDQDLRKLGIDPSRFEKQTAEQKKNLFTDSIYIQSVKTAIYASSGFLPVQTFEARTEDGTYAIGVVIRYDEDTKEIAKCLYSKQRPAISRPTGLSMKDALPTDEEMLTQFGIRLFFDETGTPSLLSFAQFGSSETSTNSRLQERAMDIAMKQAEALANSQLTEFIHSSMSVEAVNELGENEHDDLIFHPSNGETTANNVIPIIDRIRQNSKVTGSDTMAGRSTVYKKILRHPSGHPVAVVVIRWSFSQLDMINRIQQGKTPQPVTPSTPILQQTKDRGIRQGRSYDF